jgi:choline kinase
MKAVILAAGKGTRLLPLTQDLPKPMVDVAGRPLLLRIIDRLAAAGIVGTDVIVVTGYRQEVIRTRLDQEGLGACRTVFNPRWEEWNNNYSLLVAREAVGGDDVLQIDGDVLFDGKVIPRMLAAPGPGCLSIDVRDKLDTETMKVEADGEGRIRRISKQLDPRVAVGEYVGLTRLDAPLAHLVFAELERFPELGLTDEYYEHAYHRLAGRGEGPFRVANVHDCVTIEIDDRADLERAKGLLDDSMLRSSVGQGSPAGRVAPPLGGAEAGYGQKASTNRGVGE